MEEEALEPDLPIIDPHLHHWEIVASPGTGIEGQSFLLHESMATVGGSGHTVTHTVFVECHAMYRQEGPAELRSLGETEFANGIAAMSASGAYGPTRFAHRIVGNVDLRLGSAAAAVLERHIAVSGGRFVGVRHPVAFSEAGMFGWPSDPATRHLLLDPHFREGARELSRMGLTLDAWCLHTQLDELASLADALPDLVIVLDHIGTPERLGVWIGREADARSEWAARIAELSRRPNVKIKLGGMGMDLSRPVGALRGSAPAGRLADAWRPYVETCIEAFTPRRCMFESNFPPDGATASYGAMWNAFKIIAAGCSADEKDWLFRRTAAETYRI